MRTIVFTFCILVFMTACSERKTEYPDVAESFSDWNDTLIKLIEANDFISADTLSAWLVSETREASDYEELINAKTNTAILHLQRRQMNKGLEILNKNLEIIDEHGTARQKSYALVQVSNFYMIKGSNREALEAINEAIRLVPDVNDHRTEAAVYATKALVIGESDPTQSLKLNYQALDIFLEVNDRQSEAISRNNIGLRYHSQEDYSSAYEEFDKAIQINREIDNQAELSANYNNIANTLKFMGENEAAADFLLKAIEINRKLGVSPRLIQNNYNLAQIYIDTEEYEKAYSFFSLGLEESKSIKFIPGVMYHSTGLANAALKLARYDEVPGHLAESRELAERLENLRIIGLGWEIEALYMEQIGDYQRAVTALRKEQMYSDSLDNVRRDSEFEEIRTAYEVDLKVAENELLRQELSYQEDLSSIQQLVLFLLIVVVLIVVVLLVLIFRSQRNLQKAYEDAEVKNEVITSKNRELLSLNNELKQLNYDKDQLIGIIVHDLRNPLFGVVGFLDVISESVTDEFEKKHLDMARNSAQRLNNMINSLLDVHSLERNKDFRGIEEVEVDDIIANMVVEFQMIADKKQIAIRTERSGLTVETHLPYLTRIIENLVSNALKFSPSHSKVSISARHVDDSFWQLIVSDEGPGISDQDKKKMFQMFGKLTARPTNGEETTGLGLYVVNMLVERLKGSVTVDSEIGKGSKFICEFQIQLSDLKAEKKSGSREEMQLNGLSP